MANPPTISTLTFNDLSIGFTGRKEAKTLFSSLSYEVKSPALIALIGLNGTGKSTFMRTIAGVHPPLSGTLTLNHRSLSQLTVQKRAQCISMVFSQPPRTGNFTVTELLSFGRHPYLNAWSKLSHEDSQLIDRYAALFDLNDFLHRPFLELSDGEKQRVMIARAFVQETPLILMDEPTAHLDILHKRRVYHLLQQAITEHPEKIIVFSTHEPEVSLAAATEVWLIHDQQLQSFTPQSFRTDSPFAEWMKG